MKGLYCADIPEYLKSINLMKALEINALGLESLSSSEMAHLSGGNIWGWIGPILIEALIEYLLDPEGSKEDFNKGYDRVSGWLND